MQYNFHNEKYKIQDVGGIRKEQFREYDDPSKYRNYVHPDLSDENLYLDMVPSGRNWHHQIREAKESTKEMTGRAVRKDAVVLCSTVESVPETWPRDVCREYFKDKAEWFGGYLHERGGADEGCLKSLAVHFDETTPHATYAWIPVRDGKLQAKNILSKDFLRDLQRDSQGFTFDWIDSWNTEHPGQNIEELDPYTIGSQQQHLAEAEFKESKIKERIDELQDLRETLEQTRQEIGDLHSEKQQLQEKVQQAEAAKEQYEHKVIEVTQAPDIPSYKAVIEENATLKEELSLKDRVIESLKETNEKLQETAQHWKEQAAEWKERFTDIASKAGDKLMGFFGYDVSQEKDIGPYPSREVSEGIKEMLGDARDINPKSFRVIPDNENEGKFRVAMRNKDGAYETVKGSFDTRSAAESWQRDLASGVRSLGDTLEEDRVLHR